MIVRVATINCSMHIISLGEIQILGLLTLDTLDTIANRNFNPKMIRNNSIVLIVVMNPKLTIAKA